jgi:murein DD-endopeptidase MepM/ murein hydrolase activator NlpD
MQLLTLPVPGHPNSFSTNSFFGAVRAGHVHQGLDISAAPETELAAPAAFEVADVYVSTGLGGGTVVLDHGPLPGFGQPAAPGVVQTRHYHVAFDSGGRPRALVPKGGRGERGQSFAIAGETGNATAVHDHFEVYVDGRAIDPRQVIAEYAASIGGIGHRLGFLARFPGPRGLLPGPFSRVLQVMLNWWGAGVEVDGVMGPETEAALRAFQSTRGLLMDGKAGRATWSALVPAVLR